MKEEKKCESLPLVSELDRVHERPCPSLFFVLFQLESQGRFLSFSFIKTWSFTSRKYSRFFPFPLSWCTILRIISWLKIYSFQLFFSKILVLGKPFVWNYTKAAFLLPCQMIFVIPWSSHFFLQKISFLGCYTHQSWFYILTFK